MQHKNCETRTQARSERFDRIDLLGPALLLVMLREGRRVSEVARLTRARWSSVKRWKIAIRSGGNGRSGCQASSGQALPVIGGAEAEACKTSGERPAGGRLLDQAGTSDGMASDPAKNRHVRELVSKLMRKHAPRHAGNQLWRPRV
jgi:hypothetical protein